MVRIRYLIWIVVCYSLFNLGCVRSNYDEIEAIKNLKFKADQAELAEDPDTAIICYLRIESTGSRVELWEDVLYARSNLGDLYVGKKNFEEAEKKYLGAKELCEKISCSRMDDVYWQLFYFYTVIQKDLGKSSDVISESVKNKEFFGSQTNFKDLLRRYARTYQNAGYMDKAKALINEYSLN